MTPPPEHATANRQRQLLAAIHEAIAAGAGRITFRDFMELALYHPRLGYYQAAGEKIGPGGDYLTSPLVSPLFGQTIAHFARGLFEAGLPRQVLELGAGTGALTAALAPLAHCTIVERSADFRGRQQARLGERVTWSDAVPERFHGLVVMNELLDALPVHRLDRDRELYVSCQADELHEELGPYSTPRLGEYFQRLNLTPAGLAEVNLEALCLLESVYRRATGCLLIIDYGYEAEELFVRHPQGTLLTYFGHITDGRPYDQVGLKDMTSHVDFTSVMRLGEAMGWATRQFTTQAEFLIAHGIGDLLQDIQRRASEPAEYFRAREAVTSLLNPRGMGGFRVLLQATSGCGPA
ncbi:MAG TPA: SAM-dependent methyltransferase [Chloroflexota bacterium]|nr:SAM-dependent methyltransferase [Chloroflexota bacterium]